MFVTLLLCTATTMTAAPGDLDPTFGVGGKLTDWEGAATRVAIQHDGKIVIVGGSTIQLGGAYYDFQVARYNPDGTPDTTFGGGTGRVTTDFDGNFEHSARVVIQPDGKIVVAGVSNGNRTGLALARYNPNGSLDTTFGGGSGKVLTETPNWPGHVVDVALQPDGKILGVIGQVDFDGNDDIDGLLVRYNADGSLDTSFGNGGSVLTEYELASVAVQPADGKIVTRGFWRRLIARFNTDGSPDTGFGSGGTVTIPTVGWLLSIAIDSTGKIVAAGSPFNNQDALFRFNVDGSPDSSFDGDGIVTIPRSQEIASVVIQPDGKIVAAGNFGQDFVLARYNLNGSLDNTFGGGDGISTTSYFYPNEVVLDSQGRAVVVGASGTGPAYMFAIARFLGDGPSPSCSSANPIDCPDFFISQQYRDFLAREPEPSCPPGQCGLDFYLPILNGCAASDTECTKYTRGALSANFFRSPEFQAKGSYVMYLYMVAIGQRPLTVAELQDASKIERPHYSEFITDMAAISSPNDRNGPDPAKKAALTQDFVNRAEIVAKYPTSTYPTLVSFGNALAATAGVSLSLATQNAIAGATTRAQVLQIIAESAEVSTKFYQPTFVTMEYFGYLRRDPENCHDPANWWGLPDARDCGYIFQNRRFNELLPLIGSDLTQNFIVRGFIESPEYRHRFGL